MTEQEFYMLPMGAKLISLVNGHTYHKINDQFYCRDVYEPGVDPEWDELMKGRIKPVGVYGLDYLNGEALKYLSAI